jgi:hypothetical protein
MDPSPGIWARLLDGIKNWPLWLLVAIALALTVLVAVPDFRALVSPMAATALVFATIVAWIFVVARAAKPITDGVLKYLHYREQKRRFLVTPVEGKCYWGVSKQTDGSYVTNVTVQCMVKNRSTTELLHVMTARLIKPRIRGEVLPAHVSTRSLSTGMFGTPHVSGNFINTGQTLPVSCVISIRGVPRQKSGPMRAKIEFADADGQRERVKVRLNHLGPVTS